MSLIVEPDVAIRPASGPIGWDGEQPRDDGHARDG